MGLSAVTHSQTTDSREMGLVQRRHSSSGMDSRFPGGGGARATAAPRDLMAASDATEANIVLSR